MPADASKRPFCSPDVVDYGNLTDISGTTGIDPIKKKKYGTEDDLCIGASTIATF